MNLRDPLTGLPNHRHLRLVLDYYRDERASWQSAVLAAKPQYRDPMQILEGDEDEHPSQRMFALIVCGIEDFGPIYRVINMSQADEYLQDIAGALLRQFESSAAGHQEIFCMFHTNQFAGLAVLCAPNIRLVAKIAEDLRSCAENFRPRAEFLDVGVTASVGVAVCGSRGVDGLIDAGQEALARAQRRGGNCIHMVRHEVAKASTTDSDPISLLVDVPADELHDLIYLDLETRLPNRRALDEAMKTFGPRNNIVLVQPRVRLVELANTAALKDAQPGAPPGESARCLAPNGDARDLSASEQSRFEFAQDPEVFLELCKQLAHHLEPGESLFRYGNRQLLVLLPASIEDSGYSRARRLGLSMAERRTELNGKIVSLGISADVVSMGTRRSAEGILAAIERRWRETSEANGDGSWAAEHAI